MKIKNGRNTKTTFEELCLEEAKLRYSESYVKGVHDLDAALILEQLYTTYQQAKQLSFKPNNRVLALLWWYQLDKELFTDINRQIKAAGIIKKVFPNAEEFQYLLNKLANAIQAFNEENKLYAELGIQDFKEAAHYLFQEFAEKLRTIQPMNKIEFRPNLQVPIHENSVNWTSKEYIGESVNKVKAEIKETSV